MISKKQRATLNFIRNFEMFCLTIISLHFVHRDKLHNNIKPGRVLDGPALLKKSEDANRWNVPHEGMHPSRVYRVAFASRYHIAISVNYKTVPAVDCLAPSNMSRHGHRFACYKNLVMHTSVIKQRYMKTCIYLNFY